MWTGKVRKAAEGHWVKCRMLRQSAYMFWQNLVVLLVCLFFIFYCCFFKEGARMEEGSKQDTSYQVCVWR